MEFDGKKRIYYLFVPETLDPSKPAPLLIALHSAYSNGKSLVVEWEQIAAKRGIVLVAPNALGNWFIPPDSPDFLYALAESIKARCAIDSRRVYLFGYSAGGVHAAVTAVIEPEYFAAAAVYGGYIPGAKKRFFSNDSRTPIGFWVGDHDQFAPLDAVRGTANILRDIGFPVRITVVEGADHGYPAPFINEDIWSFLESKALTHTPHWIEDWKSVSRP